MRRALIVAGVLVMLGAVAGAVADADVNPLGVAINYELDAYIEDAGLGAVAEAQFLRDLDRSTEVKLLDGRIRRGSVQISAINK